MATREQYLNLMVSIKERQSLDGGMDEIPIKPNGSPRKQVSCYYEQGSLMERCVEIVCEQLLQGNLVGDGMRIMQSLPAEVMQLLVDKLVAGGNHIRMSNRSLDGVRILVPGCWDPGLGDGHVLHDAEILRSFEGCEFYDVCLDGAGYTRIEQDGYYWADLQELHRLRQNLFPKNTLERVMILNKKPLPTARRVLYSPHSMYDDAFLIHHVMGCKKLRHLHLEYCDDVAEKSLSRILPGLSLLEMLKVRHCHNIKDMTSPMGQCDGKEQGAPLRNLHTILFESCLRVSNLGMFLKRIGASNIVELRVSCCPLLRNNDAMEIASLCAGLQVLHIGSTGITDVGIQCISTLKNLKRLLLPGLRVRDSSIANCVQSMMYLEELDVSRCFMAGDGTLASLASSPCQSFLKILSMMLTNITDDGLSLALPRLPSLEYVNFESCDVSDIGLVHLRHAQGLQKVHIADTLAGNDTMEALSHLQHISTLDVSFTNCINDIGLKFIGRMYGLHHLILESLDRFSSPGLRHLVHLAHLKTLDLFGCRITDAVCSIISTIKSLKKLDIGWGDVSSAGVKELSKLSKLQHLSLAHCHHIRDDCVPFLLGMKHLSSLNISECRIKPGMLLMLSALPSLKVLCLADTPISCHVLEDLIERNSGLEIKGLK